METKLCMEKGVFLATVAFSAVLLVALTFFWGTLANAGLEEGQQLFTKYCASCHGQTGKGDGPLSANLNPKPKDLTDKKYMAQQPDEYYYTIIREGGIAMGKSPIMPAWGKLLKEDQIHDILLYIDSLYK